MTPEKLLREYIQHVLKEDDTGSVYGDLAIAGAGMNPYGMSFGDNDDFKHVFIDPFTDVLKTASGKGKELSVKAQTLAKVAFETVVTALIPVIKNSYAEIFAHEKEQIDKIKEEYAEVYQSNWDAFKDNDVFCTAFCYAPAAILTAQLVSKVPEAAMKMISVLSGGELDHWLGKVKKEHSKERKKKKEKSDGWGGEYYNTAMEGFIREDIEDGEKPKSLADVLSSDKVKHKLEQYPLVKKMEQSGRELVRGTLQQAYNQAKGVLKASSLAEIEKALGKKTNASQEIAKIQDPKERQASEQKIVQSIKTGLRDFYTKNLEGQVKQALDAGISEDSEYVRDVKNVAGKIKAL